MNPRSNHSITSSSTHQIIYNYVQHEIIPYQSLGCSHTVWLQPWEIIHPPLIQITFSSHFHCAPILASILPACQKCMSCVNQVWFLQMSNKHYRGLTHVRTVTFSKRKHLTVSRFKLQEKRGMRWALSERQDNPVTFSAGLFCLLSYSFNPRLESVWPALTAAMKTLHNHMIPVTPTPPV